VLFLQELTPAASFLTMAALEEHGDAKCGRRPDRAGGRPPSTCARENADIVLVARCGVRRRRREGDSMVRGVRFLVDETGRETAVQMGLESRHRSGLAPTRAVTRSGILCHASVRGGAGVRTIQELLGHCDVQRDHDLHPCAEPVGAQRSSGCPVDVRVLIGSR
jgi:hypothetical protein